MSRRRTLKSIHLVGTAWFMLCVGYIAISALRQAGVRWWVIFSLSGHSLLIALLLLSLYLFAIFRGASKSQTLLVEHPVTVTSYYAVFYSVSPFLGAVAACLVLSGARITEWVFGITFGVLWTTFLVWIIVDPVIGLVEAFLPESRRHRIERLARLRALRAQRDQERKRLLADVLSQEEQDKYRWEQALRPQAEKLARLLAKQQVEDTQMENEAVDIGANAWRTGGLSCMRQLHAMAVNICRKKYNDRQMIDYTPIWWDGIGSWRTSSLFG